MRESLTLTANLQPTIVVTIVAAMVNAAGLEVWHRSMTNPAWDHRVITTRTGSLTTQDIFKGFSSQRIGDRSGVSHPGGFGSKPISVKRL